MVEYIQHNWFQITVDIVASFNVVVAGAKAMGWDKIANECQKIEGAIQAMVAAALNKKGV